MSQCDGGWTKARGVQLPLTSVAVAIGVAIAAVILVVDLVLVFVGVPFFFTIVDSSMRYF